MSQAASSYARLDGDRYYTPPWVTEALLSVESFDGLTVDPAAGGWHLVDAMRRAGCLCEGFDISPDPALIGEWLTGDFLKWEGLSSGARCRNIVTNPPYGTGGGTAVAFIRKALADTEPSGGKVAMLLRVDFDSAHGRRNLFADHPAFKVKYVLTRRIRWANLEQKASGPTENHAWFVWDWRPRYSTIPTLRYLPLDGGPR